MEKNYKAYVALILNGGFNIMVYKNASVYFTVSYSYEISKYLPRILNFTMKAMFIILN